MLVITRKTGEAFYINDQLFKVNVRSEHFILLECQGKTKLVATDQPVDLMQSPWKLDMRIHAVRINMKFNKVVLGCEGPRNVIVLRKELVHGKKHHAPVVS